jgi:hypothetical protein
MGELQPMFEDFKNLTGVKKIMSFGGWSVSTGAETSPIFRQGVGYLAVRHAQNVKLIYLLKTLGLACESCDVCEQRREVCCR